MELTESDNAQTNWQARGSRSGADFKGSATAQVLSCRIYQRNSHNAGAMDKCTKPAWRSAAFELQQADESAQSFAKSNTKRLIGSADWIWSPDTSRSSP